MSQSAKAFVRFEPSGPKGEMRAHHVACVLGSFMHQFTMQVGYAPGANFVKFMGTKGGAQILSQYLTKGAPETAGAELSAVMDTTTAASRAAKYTPAIDEQLQSLAAKLTQFRSTADCSVASETPNIKLLTKIIQETLNVATSEEGWDANTMTYVVEYDPTSECIGAIRADHSGI